MDNGIVPPSDRSEEDSAEGGYGGEGGVKNDEDFCRWDTTIFD